ncbi:MAG: hypothetical protein IKK43_01010 [Clostridia bacterium]|nr:hypothetical protein [Clostridia bacterium]
MYIIDRTDLKYKKSDAKKKLSMACLFGFFVLIFILDGIEDFETFVYLAFFSWMTYLFAQDGVTKLKEVKKQEEICNYLEVHGTLFKNMTYYLDEINNKKEFVVELEINLNKIKLPVNREIREKCTPTKKVDVLIDLENPEKYFIDKKIEEYKSEYTGNEIL